MTTITKPRQRSPLFWLISVLALSALILGVWSAYRLTASGPVGAARTIATQSATVIPSPRPLKSFALSDHSGKPFSNTELQGHWTFMTFGYTYCPDVCPTTLATLSQAAHLLEQDKLEHEPRFVFVSIDPERDSPERLASYVPYFNTRFLGATGTQPALRELTGQLGVLYRKVENEPTALAYLMDHSASVMLADPQGRLHAVFGAPHDAEAIANDFRAIRHNYER
jgi:protein SCO1/2